MYRHLAEFIKETDDRQFMSKTDVEQLRSYENLFREKKDTYNKHELEDFINEFNNVYETVEGYNLSIPESVEAFADNIEIYGNTVQWESDLSYVKSVGEKLPDGRYKIPIVCTGVNLFNGEYQQGHYPGGVFTAAEECRSTHKIKAKPNTKYSKSSSNRGVWHFYRSEGSYIGCIDGNETTITTPEEAQFIILHYHTGELTDNIDKFMVVEGDTLPEYREYEELRTEIILDEPLALLSKSYNNSGILKQDKILKVDGIWGVEKQTRHRILDGSEIWVINHRMTNTIGFNGIFSEDNDITGQWAPIIKGLPVNNSHNDDIEGTYCGISDEHIYLTLSREKTTDGASITSYLQKNNMEILYALRESKFIPLPDNQQVKLKTFKGLTHIYFDCEINGKIKCGITKTKKGVLNSTVEEIKTLGEELELIEKIENGTKTTINGQKSIVEIESTSNGYIDEIKIEGETLVNLCNIYEIISYITDVPSIHGYSKEDGYFKLDFDIEYLNNTSLDQNTLKIESGKRYTYIAHIKENNLTLNAELFPFMWEYAINKSRSEYLSPGFEGYFIISFDAISDTYFKMCYRHINQSGRGSYKVGKVMVLEGDYSDRDISYFKGLQSVGDGIDTITINTRNQNLLDINKLFNNSGPHTNANITVQDNKVVVKGLSTSDSISNTGVITTGYVPEKVKHFVIPVVEGKTYVYRRHRQLTDIIEEGLNKSSEYGSLLDVNLGFVQLLNFENNTGVVTTEGAYVENVFTVPKGVKYLTIRVGIRACATCIYSDMSLREVDHDIVEHRSDTKQLLFKNESGEWEKPILRSVSKDIKDIICKHSDGNYYYHRNCEEIVIDGTETFSIHQNISIPDSTTVFIAYTNVEGRCDSRDLNIKCDKLSHVIRREFTNTDSISYQVNNYTEHNAVNAWISISISNSKLESPDIAGVKKWLSDNRPTIIIPRRYNNKTNIFECSPIDLQTYDGDTQLYISTGYITPKLTSTISSDIGSTVHILKERISSLETKLSENYIFDSVVLLQSMYSADIANLQYDINTFTNSSYVYAMDDYDQDLYRIIKDIIYDNTPYSDKVEMENIIDFYTMIGKLSFTIAEELFDILHLQLNE